MLAQADVDHMELFEQLYAYVPIGVALISTKGACLRANPAFCDILGYTEEELRQLSFRDVTHPDDLEEEERIYADLLAGHALSRQREKRYCRKDGKLVWASVFASVIRDASSGEPLYILTHLIDETERKRSEQKLLDIEQAYRLISENARDVVYVSNPDNLCEFISPSVKELLGYEPESFIGKNSLELYHPADLAAYSGKAIGEDEALTYRIRHKDGRWIWFETTFRQLRDADGKVLRTVAIGRDITERKKHEDNLAEAQRIAQIGSWEWDLATKEVILSNELCRMYGVEPKAAERDPSLLLAFVHPDDQENILGQLGRSVAGEPIALEYRQVQQDGPPKYLMIRGGPIRDEDGEIVRITGTVQDISDRKQMEQKLQETVERYNSLKKYNHDAVFSLGLDGRFINCNVMATRLTGYQPEELSGRHYSDFFEADNLARNLAAIGTEGDQAENEMDRIRHRDGHWTEVLTAIAPIIINEKMTGYYIIAKDFTEQKKLVIEKEAAESTNKAKSSFFAMMSHEIRTPMNGVIGMADLLMETGLDAEQQEYVQVIRRSGESLVKIINDILDFSKIEFGNTELAQERFDTRQCLLETMELLYPLARGKHLKLDWDVAREVPPYVVGDCDRLRQILNNLIGNAIKFTEQGEVHATVRLAAEEEGRVCLSFTVRDTGIGIPPDKVKYLFEPFSQLDSFMQRSAGGTGLGLAISKKLVELMGGRIHVIQPEGPGAMFAFTVWFDVDRKTGESVRQPGEDEQGGGGRLRMLVAEDNEINQLVLKRLLEKQGHEVVIAINGKEAVKKVKEETFDIVFMDVQMPEMNGLDATRAIREAMPAGASPVIIAVTANASTQDREQCLAAGMDDYVSKPLKVETVKDAIRRHGRLLGR